MNCPNCQCEMEKGFIQSGRYILWTKKIQNLSMKPRNKESLIIAENLLGGATVSAFCCKSCKKIIIEY